MADLLKFFRVLAIPANPEPDSVYFVKVGPDTVDVVVTSNDGVPHTALKGPASTVPGPPGPGADAYEHLQASPSAVWVVNHNFGRNPAVAIVDTAGREVEADVVHTSLNQFQVLFNQPIPGKAIAR